MSGEWSETSWGHYDPSKCWGSLMQWHCHIPENLKPQQQCCEDLRLALCRLFTFIQNPFLCSFLFCSTKGVENGLQRNKLISIICMAKSLSKMYLTTASCKVNESQLRAVSGHSSCICVTLCTCRPLLLGIFIMWLDCLKVGNTKQPNINRQWWYILTAVCLKIYPDGRYIMSLCSPLRNSCVRWAPARI